MIVRDNPVTSKSAPIRYSFSDKIPAPIHNFFLDGADNYGVAACLNILSESYT